LIFGLSFQYQGMGYVIALILSPLLTALFFIKKLKVKLRVKNNLEITNLSFWKYGFFGGLSSLVTQLLILIDIILIGYLIDDPVAVTHYRYVSIIPFSLLFLPRVFITTDFVTFTEKIHQKDYINKYIKNYMVFFGVVSILLVLFSYIFVEQILNIFGEEYTNYADSFLILILGITGIYIFRGLFGNLLSSIGKIKFNYYIISIAILINIISNYYLIPTYGIKGAAITSAILMWFTGVFSWLSFLYFYKKNRYE
jgi:O-antigen/teichoic acid export membrane protein